MEQFHKAAGGPKATADLTTIVTAARQAAIDTLLLAEGQQQWGTVDEQTGQVESAGEQNEAAEDLLNLAAVYTLRGGGMVYCLRREQMPDQNQAAAILRFPMPVEAKDQKPR